jgi:hypothetical protein
MDGIDKNGLLNGRGTMDEGQEWNGHVQQVTFFVPVHSSIKRQVHSVHSVHDVHSCPCPLKTLILPFE